MRCPRDAFIQDICNSINKASEEGNDIILLIDGNSNMKDSALKTGLEQCCEDISASKQKYVYGKR
jgi:hypothetical protein